MAYKVERLSDDVTLYCGDCLEVMAEMEANSVDAVITDPPYGLQFMGKEWDHGVPREAFWREALRVAKPGAWLLAFGGTRTFHRLMVAIEDAGWEIRDTVMWVYGSGFPKSHNVSKAIDKMYGAEREVVGVVQKLASAANVHKGWERPWAYDEKGEPKRTMDITAPATPESKQWDGWGTALKPAWEPVVVARKPVIGTVAENVLEWGTGGINIDGCRVEYISDDDKNSAKWGHQTGNVNDYGNGVGAMGGKDVLSSSKGRWPANLIHDGSDEVLALFPIAGGGGPGRRQREEGDNYRQVGAKNGIYGKRLGATGVTSWYDEPRSSAARFFYCAKASRTDRNEGLEEMPLVEAQSTGWSGDGMPLRQDGTERKMPIKSNPHPTVKPTDLMRYLCRLVTPPGGTVLDPFMGSGSTGKAAMLEGFNFIGIELDADSVEIAKRRIEHARKQPRLV